MTAKTVRQIGNVVLIVAIGILLVTIAGMAGWMPKIWPSREMNLVVFVLVILAHRLRRRRDEVVPPPKG